MITFKRILFPVDFSERCAATVRSVQAMVKRFGSELTVLHVVDLAPALGIAPPEAAAWATLIGADSLRENGKIALERFVAREFPGRGLEGRFGRRRPCYCDCRLCSGSRSRSDHDAHERTRPISTHAARLRDY